MKKLIFLTIFTFVIGGVAMAQDTDYTPKKIQKQDRTQVRKKDQLNIQDGTKIQERKQERIHSRNEAALQGETVSSVAKNTESGSGKGEIVRQEARNKGENQKMRDRENISARNQSMGARGNAMQRNSNMRMQKGPGAGRK